MVTTGGGGVKRKFFETRKSLVCLNADGQVPMDRGLNWPQEVELCPWERGNSVTRPLLSIYMGAFSVPDTAGGIGIQKQIKGAKTPVLVALTFYSQEIDSKQHNK